MIRYPIEGDCPYVVVSRPAKTEMATETLGANRIEVCIDTQNGPSIRVARKAGFRLEGTLVNERRLADGTQLELQECYRITPYNGITRMG